MVKKMSRVKVMYILLAVLVMFCSVCPRFVVLAADGSTDDTKLGSNIAPYMHGEDYVTKSGYLYQNKSFKTKLNKDNASAVYKNPSPYECENTCFKENGEPAIKSNQQQWSDFLAELGTQDFTGSNDLYFVLYETSGLKQYGTGASIYAYYMWVPSGSKICMAYSANTAGSDDSYYNLYEFARVFTSSDVGGISSLGGNLAGGYDKFFSVVHGDTNGDTSFFEKDSSIGYRGFRFKVQNADTGLGDFRLMATNIPLVKCAENENGYIEDYINCKKFLEGQTDLADNQNPDYVEKKKEGCDSFGWDSFVMNVVPEAGVDNKSSYKFSATYNYDSFPKMVVSPDDYQFEFKFSVRVCYKMKSAVLEERSFDLGTLKANVGDFPNNYTAYLNSLDVEGVTSDDVSFGSFMDSVTTGVEAFGTLLGLDKGDIVNISSSDLYCTAFVRKIGGNSGLSGQQSFAKWSLSTFEKTDLSNNITASTTGEGKDKKVTQVVGNDGGKTVINITVNVTGGTGGDGGSGGSGGDGGSGGGGSGTATDPSASGFWSILKGIVAFFKALLDGEDGLFPVIAAFFEFIPAGFWTVVIGAVVIIAVISIYKLLKK